MVPRSSRQRLARLLAPVSRNIDRHLIRRAPYAIRPYPSSGQRNALISNAIEHAAPPGLVIARPIPTDREGCTVEVLTGWERVEAYLHPDAFPHARQVPLALMSVTDEDAAYYAIELGMKEHAAAGYLTSPIAYATAAGCALAHFSTKQHRWSIQDLANALCIARPTLSNRLRLLKGLQPRVRELIDNGALKPECAKILLAERSPLRQVSLAERAATGALTTRALYRAVHPGYEPPKLVQRRRRASQGRLGDTGAMERTLEAMYGAPAQIAMEASEDGAGFVELRFHSLAELKGLLETLDHRASTDTLFRGELTFHARNSADADSLLHEMGATRDLD